MTPFIEPITGKEPDPNIDQPLWMLDFERELAGPDGARLCEDFIGQFNNYLVHIESIQRSGLSPNQFNQSETIRAALESAVNCMSLSRSLLP